jgi:hypothetical protein
LKHDVVCRLAEKHGITPANVLVSFQVNTPNVNGEEFCRATPLVNLLTHAPIRKVLAKSVTPERIICESFVPNLFMDHEFTHHKISEP